MTTILVVDDSTVDRKYAAGLLAKEDAWEVIQASERWLNDVNFGSKGHEVESKWRPLIHRMPKNNVGGALPLPANPPAVVAPPVIEIIQDKKN